MNNKNSFILYHNQYELINELTNEQAGLLFKSIFEYEINKISPELTGSTKIVFLSIKQVLDVNNDKYESICERNKMNGAKGGRPKNSSGFKKNPKNPSGFLENPKKPKKADIDIDIDIDMDIDIDSSTTIYDFIERNFSRTLSPIEYEEIQNWEDNELTRYAIKQSVLNGKCNIKYISRILDSYKRNSITTVQQAQTEEETFKQSKQAKTIKQIKIEEEPKWFNEDIEEGKDKEKIKLMEEMLHSFD